MRIQDDDNWGPLIRRGITIKRAMDLSGADCGKRVVGLEAPYRSIEERKRRFDGDVITIIHHREPGSRVGLTIRGDKKRERWVEKETLLEVYDG